MEGIIKEIIMRIVQAALGCFPKISKNIPKIYIILFFYIAFFVYVVLLIITVILFLPNNTIEILGFSKINECIGDYRGIFAVSSFVVLLFVLDFEIGKIKEIKRIVKELDTEELIILQAYFYKPNRNMAMLKEDLYTTLSLEMKGVIIKMIKEARDNWNAVYCFINPSFKKEVYKRLKNFKIPESD